MNRLSLIAAAFALLTAGGAGTFYVMHDADSSAAREVRGLRDDLKAQADQEAALIAKVKADRARFLGQTEPAPK